VLLLGEHHSLPRPLRFWYRALRALLCVAAVPRPIKLIDPRTRTAMLCLSQRNKRVALART